LVNVLERGEKIDDLVARSSDLSFEARAFYKTVRNSSSFFFLFFTSIFFRLEKRIDVVLYSNHLFPSYLYFIVTSARLSFFLYKIPGEKYIRQNSYLFV